MRRATKHWPIAHVVPQRRTAHAAIGGWRGLTYAPSCPLAFERSLNRCRSRQKDGAELAFCAELSHNGTIATENADEMYEKLIYDNVSFHAFAGISDDAFRRSVTINGLSKCGAMPGWRFGYMASKNKDLNKAIIKLQGQSTSNICSITQYAAIPALLGEADKDIEAMRLEFEKRRNKACELISSIEGLKLAAIPQGAFYLFINIKDVEKDSMLFCKELLARKKVALVPGLGFGMDGFVRFSYATSLENITNGLERIKEFIKEYRAK